MTDIYDADFLIHSYGLREAIEDGMLVEKFTSRWPQLSGGKPIVASIALDAAVSEAGLIEVWNDYVHWRREVMPTLPIEVFADSTETSMNSERVWVLEDGTAFTMLRPEDY